MIIDTIVTCAPFDVSVLCGDSIKIISYTDAQLDEATWSIHFKDADSNAFHLPLRLCRTWFVCHRLSPTLPSWKEG